MELFDADAGDFAETGEGPFAGRPARPSRAEVEAAVRILIAATGDDPDREGLADTPSRVARAYREWFSGYSVDPSRLLERTFGEAADYEETILLAGIRFVSTCEHHMAPIAGVAHVAYRPRRRVVGISKLVRLVDAHARRLQLQERLTTEIANTIDRALKPRGVAVILEAGHDCLATRGVHRPGIAMVTKCWLGDFRSDSRLRRELMESLASRTRSGR
jgi:GTP cyclohydrolase I